MKFYVDNHYAYCQEDGAGRKIPPYGSNGKVSQSKHVCSKCSKHSASATYRSDCSTYVSWVIYEYAKAHGYSDLQKVEKMDWDENNWEQEEQDIFYDEEFEKEYWWLKNKLSENEWGKLKYGY